MLRFAAADAAQADAMRAEKVHCRIKVVSPAGFEPATY
jgi:hypothetical protein